MDGWMASESTSNQYSGRFIIKTGWDNFTNYRPKSDVR